MEIELNSTVSVLPETFSVLVSPVEMLAGALKSHLELQRYKILFICGYYSRILSRLDRNFTELEVRRAPAPDADLKGGDRPALRTCSGPPPAEDDELADRVFCIYNEQAPAKGRKAEGEDAGSEGHFGGILMSWPWRCEAGPIEPRRAADLKVIELQIAKEILAEVFVAGSARRRR